MKTIVNRDENFGKRVTNYEANIIFTDLPKQMNIDLIISQLHTKYLPTKEVARSLNRKISFYKIGQSINATILYFETFTIDDDYWDLIQKDLDSEVQNLENILNNVL
jgi:hypothetical protein